jgi:hypothetical protein
VQLVSHRRSQKSDHLASLVAAFDQRNDVVIPHCHNLLNRDCVLRFIVNARNSTLVTALVVQERLDDMRLDPEVAQARCGCSPQIMQCPISNLIAQPRIELFLLIGQLVYPLPRAPNRVSQPTT